MKSAELMFSILRPHPSPPEIDALSLHDALPISNSTDPLGRPMRHNEFTDDYTVKIPGEIDAQRVHVNLAGHLHRSEEHTSELQSHHDHVCRVPLGKKSEIHSLPINFLHNVVLRI